ncbi:hypothetical protein G6F59_015910 [Rhizopus arrhizus]|nr:hypothetical protein G6F59_015910 [Rhizopus arrhizus]
MDAPGQAQAVGQPRGHRRVAPPRHVAFRTRCVGRLRGHADHLLGGVAVTGHMHGHADAWLELIIQHALGIVAGTDGEHEVLRWLERQRAAARAQPTQPRRHRLQHRIADLAAQRIGHQLQATQLHEGDGVTRVLLVQLSGQRAPAAR